MRASARQKGQAILEYLVIAGVIMAAIVSLGGLMNNRARALLRAAEREMTSPSARVDGLIP